MAKGWGQSQIVQHRMGLTFLLSVSDSLSVTLLCVSVCICLCVSLQEAELAARILLDQGQVTAWGSPRWEEGLFLLQDGRVLLEDRPTKAYCLPSPTIDWVLDPAGYCCCVLFHSPSLRAGTVSPPLSAPNLQAPSHHRGSPHPGWPRAGELLEVEKWAGPWLGTEWARLPPPLPIVGFDSPSGDLTHTHRHPAHKPKIFTHLPMT